MKNAISIKMQTPRSTTWHDKKCININLFYKNFQMGLVTSGQWGNTDQENPVVEFTVDGEEYMMQLSDFKNLIQKKAIKYNSYTL